MSKIKLIFAGDVFISDSLSVDNILSQKLANLFRDHDIVGCNFEGPIREKASKPIIKAGSHLSQTNEAAKLVNKAGFNLINLANNHIFDFGQESLKKTLKSFKSKITVGAGLNYHSAYCLKTTIVKGVKIGFLSYGESEFGAIREEKQKGGGFAWVNHPSVRSIVAASKKDVDILIIQVHAGIEELSIPLPEWRQIYYQLINCGADIVIGHHPHVPQGWELYKNKPIFYSLGNFYFQKGSFFDGKGIVVSLTFIGRNLKKWEVIPIMIVNEQVQINEDIKYKKYLHRLCKDLRSKNYIELVNLKCVELWKKRYKKYYYHAMGSRFGYYIGKPNIPLLLHNLRIESHRWLVERVLSNRLKNYGRQ